MENNLDLTDYLFSIANYNNFVIAQFHFLEEEVHLWYVYIVKMRKDAGQVWKHEAGHWKTLIKRFFFISLVVFNWDQ